MSDLKRHLNGREYREKGASLAKDFTNTLNSMTYDKEIIEGFVEQITKREHRTLQQSSMRAIVSLILEWAKMYEDGNFDGRNAETLKLCKKIKDSISEEGFYLPFI